MGSSQLKEEYGVESIEMDGVTVAGIATRQHMTEGDLEDAMAEDLPIGKNITAHIVVNDKSTLKPKALHECFLNWTTHTSTDRLKRVQHLPCFTDTSDPENNLISFDSPLGQPPLHIGNPVASLVQCERMVFLVIGQVNWIMFGGHSDVSALNINLLDDKNTKISYQILRIRPATIADDPGEQHDWIWSLKMELHCENVPESLIHPLNPTVSVQTPGQPTYLFASDILLTITASIYGELAPSKFSKIPAVKQTDYFPYQNSLGM